MPVFIPPADLHDVSSYTFTGQGRRIIVRHSGKLGLPQGLLAVAADYASQLKRLLDLDPTVSPLRTRNDATPFVTVSSGFTENGSSIVERSAFLRFINGVSAQIAITAPADDASAGSFFEQLIDSATPSPPVTQTKGVMVAHAAQSSLRAAGPVTIAIPPEYQDVSVLRFRSADGSRQVSIKPNEALPSPSTSKSRLSRVGKLKKLKGLEKLAANQNSAQDDRGQLFHYESGEDLWAQSAALRAQRKASARKVPARGVQPKSVSPRTPGKSVSAAAATGPERVSTKTVTVGGKTVTVHYRSSVADDPTAADSLAATIKRASAKRR